MEGDWVNLPSITVKKTSRIFLGALTHTPGQLYLLPRPPLACSLIVVAPTVTVITVASFTYVITS